MLLPGPEKTGNNHYPPETNGLVEHYNCTIVARLQHYVADHQCNWDLCMEALTYENNTQTHHATALSHFFVILPPEQPSAAKLDRLTGVPTGVSADTLPYDLNWKLIYCVTAMRMTFWQGTGDSTAMLQPRLWQIHPKGADIYCRRQGFWDPAFTGRTCR